MPSNEELMQKASRGEKAAFEQLVERLWLPAVRYAFALCRDPDLAQDLAQEGLVRLYLHRSDYGAGRRVLPLLLRILRNLGVDHARRSRTRAAMLQEISAMTRAKQVTCPAAAVEQQEELAEFYRALKRLSPQHQQLLVLREMQGLSYKEMADTTGLSFDSVRVELHRARRRLARELRSNGHETGDQDQLRLGRG